MPGALNLVQTLTLKTVGDAGGIDQIHSGLTNLDAKSEESGSKLGSALKLGAAAGGVAVVAALGDAIAQASKFDDALAKTAALAGASNEEMGQYRDGILKLTETIPVSANAMADALFLVKSAGFQGADALNILKISGEASAAGLGDMKTVADTVTSALNAYHLSGQDAAKITDTLTAAVTAGKAQAADFAPAMGRILPIAASMGVSFDQVAASLATMTRVGLSTDEASTALRGTLSALEKPGKDAQEALKSIGLSADEVRQSIKDKGLLATLQDLMDRTGGNTETLTHLIPNVRALTGVLATAGSQANEYADILNKTQNAQGSTERAFAKMSETASFQMDLIKNNLNKVMIEVGSKILPLLTPILQAMAEGIPKVFDAISAVVGPVIDALGRGVDAFMKFGHLILDIAQNWGIDKAWSVFTYLVGQQLDHLGDVIVNGLKSGWEFISGLAGTIIGFVQQIDWPGVGTAILNGVKTAFNFLKDHWLEIIITAVYGPIGLALFEVGKRLDWSAIWSGIQNIGSGFIDALRSGVHIAVELGTWLGQEFTNIPWARIFQNMSDFGRYLLQGLQQGLNITEQLGTWLAQEISNIPWARIWSGIQGVGSSILNGLKAGANLAEELGNWIGDEVGKIDWKAIWGHIVDLGTLIVDGMKAGAHLATEIANWFSDEVSNIDWDKVWSNVTGFTDSLNKKVQDAVKGVSGITDQLGKGSVAGGIFEDIGNQIGGLVGKLIPSQQALQSFFNSFEGLDQSLQRFNTQALQPILAGLSSLGQVLLQVFQQAIVPLAAILGGALLAALEAALHSANALGIGFNDVLIPIKAVINVLADVIDIITAVVKLVIDLVHGDWSAAWDDAKRIFLDAWDAILQPLRAAKDILLPILEGITGAVKDAIIGLIGWLTGHVGDVLTFILAPWKQAASDIGDAAGGILGGFFNSVTGAMNAVWTWLTQHGGDILTAATQPFHDLVTAIGDGVAGGGGLLGTFFDKVTGAAHAVWDWFTQHAADISGALLKPFADFGSGVEAAIKGGFGAVHQALQSAVDGFKTFVNGVGSAVNWVSGKLGLGDIVQPWDGIQIPGFASGTSNWRGGMAIVGEVGPELVYLPQGASVVPADVTAQLKQQGKIPGFQFGLDFDWVTDAFNGVKSLGKDAFDFVKEWAAKGVEALVDHALDLFHAVAPDLPGALQKLGPAAFTTLRKDIIDTVTKMFEGGKKALPPDVTSFNGSPVNLPGSVTDWLEQAAQIALGRPLTDNELAAMLWLVNQESGGSPTAVNPVAVVVNGVDYGHATGLLQTLPGTFASNNPGGNIFNPVDNAVAAIRYIMATYHGDLTAPARAEQGGAAGYAQGGILRNKIVGIDTVTGQQIMIAENGPEAVIPLGGASAVGYAGDGGTSMGTVINWLTSINDVLYNEIRTRLDTIIGHLSNIASSAKTTADHAPATADNTKATATNTAAGATNTAGVAALGPAAAVAATGLQHTADVVKPLNDHLQESIAVVKPLNDHLNESIKTVKPLNDHLQESVAVVKPLNDGLRETVAVTKPLNDGLNESIKVVKPLNDGLNESVKVVTPLNDGLRETTAATKPLNDGLNESVKVVTPLNDHLREMANVTKPLTDGLHESIGATQAHTGATNTAAAALTTLGQAAGAAQAGFFGAPQLGLGTVRGLQAPVNTLAGGIDNRQGRGFSGLTSIGGGLGGGTGIADPLQAAMDAVVAALDPASLQVASDSLTDSLRKPVSPLNLLSGAVKPLLDGLDETTRTVLPLNDGLHESLIIIPPLNDGLSETNRATTGLKDGLQESTRELLNHTTTLSIVNDGLRESTKATGQHATVTNAATSAVAGLGAAAGGAAANLASIPAGGGGGGGGFGASSGAGGVVGSVGVNDVAFVVQRSGTGALYVPAYDATHLSGQAFLDAIIKANPIQGPAAGTGTGTGGTGTGTTVTPTPPTYIYNFGPGSITVDAKTLEDLEYANNFFGNLPQAARAGGVG